MKRRISESKLKIAKNLYEKKHDITCPQICEILSITERTIYKYAKLDNWVKRGYKGRAGRKKKQLFVKRIEPKSNKLKKE